MANEYIRVISMEIFQIAMDNREGNKIELNMLFNKYQAYGNHELSYVDLFKAVVFLTELEKVDLYNDGTNFQVELL